MSRCSTFLSFPSFKMTECTICFDTFNKSTRSPTSCTACAAKICRTCLQTFLLQDDGKDPTCASCKAPWTHTFLYSTLTQTFRTGPYKLHREKVLYDREKARLPDTQEDAHRYKNAKELLTPLKAERDAIRAEMEAIPEVAAALTAERAFRALEKTNTKDRTIEHRRNWWKSQERHDKIKHADSLRKKARKLQKPFLTRISAVEEAMNVPRHIMGTFGLLPRNYGAGAATEAPKERRQFIMKCPEATCEGFLSQNYKCGMCDIQVCAACHVTKKEDHVCDMELVETIKQIKKEARPCPKCASLISKIDGCDQMWCTQCNTAFSWNTGKIETQVIHNPHYFAWMRATGQVLPRMGEGPAHACAEINTLGTTMTCLRRQMLAQQAATGQPPPLANVINALDSHHRNALHVQHVTLREYQYELRNLTDEEPRRILRVRRLVNELKDDEWKFMLQKKEKATYKVQAWIQLLEMYASSNLETMARLSTNPTPEELTSVKNQLDTLRAYVDKEAADIANVYSCVLPRELRYAPPAAMARAT